ncbi:MAG: permease [Chloroflexi bacterium]|nr:permease [Chloroflexota bacterium]
MEVADTLTVFSTRFLGIFIEAAPFLLLGTVTSGLIEAFISHDDLMRILPRHPVLATVAGGLMGFAFPVCECGVVPVTRRLYRKGLPLPVGIAFLLAAPVVNPIVIASTYAAFHARAIEIVYLRVAVALVAAVLIGLLFGLQSRADRLLREPGHVPAWRRSPSPPAPAALAVVHDPEPSLSGLPGRLVLAPAGAAPALAANARPSRMALIPGLRHALSLAAEEFFEMGRYLILGSLLAAGLRVVITQGQLEALATNPVNSVFVMQALAFLLSICSTADAFVALDFANTFTLGSILGFLTFGPMVDIKSTLMFLGVFRRRAVLYLILLPFLMTTLIAIWVNLNVRF